LAMSLQTPDKIRNLQRKLYLKAKVDSEVHSQGTRRFGYEAFTSVCRRKLRGEASRKAVCRESACTVVCPVKAGVFSRGQTCRGRSQSPVAWIAEEMETEPSKPIDKISLGEVASHRAVSTENALWPRK
jgi:hypothetical protein